MPADPSDQGQHQLRHLPPAGRPVLRAHPARALLRGRRRGRGRRLPCGQVVIPGGSHVKVVVDYDVCASTGSCMQVCPEVFEVRSDGYLYILQEEPGEELRDEGRGRPPTSARRARSPSRDEERSSADGLPRSTRQGLVDVRLDAVRRARSRSGGFPGPLDGSPDAIERFCTRSSTPPPISSPRSSRSSPTSHRNAPSRRSKGSAATSARRTPTSWSSSTPSAVTSARRPSTTPGRRSGATPPTR